jgi:pilus assembly protein Flp/PilA
METNMEQAKSFLAQLIADESGQDLVEYALVVALIGFAAVAGMQSLALTINSAFISIGSKLTSSIP